MKRAGQFPARQRGMILVMTIWFLATLAVAAGVFALWVNRAAAELHADQQQVQAEVDALSTRSTLLYLIASRGLRPDGLHAPLGEGAVVAQMSAEELLAAMETGQSFETSGESEVLALDDRPYTGLGSVRFSLQDEAGLIPVNLEYDGGRLEALLKSIGVDDDQRTKLLARLRDYIDRDDLHRLNGAEAAHYKEQGISGPANEPLLSVEEIARVMGWAALVTPDLLQSLTVANPGAQNVNAMPVPVLRALMNLGDEQIARLLTARREKPFTSFADLLARTGVNAQGGMDGGLAPTPSPFLRLRFWSPAARLSRLYRIEFTPFSADPRPWVVQSVEQLPVLDNHAESQLTRTKSALFNDAN